MWCSFSTFVILIVTALAGKNSDPKACDTCSKNVCSILPPYPPGSSPSPCYQGTNSDVKVCYNTDPLILSGAKWVCGYCEDYGYPTYLYWI
jgi:hypothetical protein